MKAIFLTLLLANLGFVAWRIWIVQSQAPPVFVEAEGLPQLVLLGEDPDAVGAVLRNTASASAPSAMLAGDEELSDGTDADPASPVSPAGDQAATAIGDDTGNNSAPDATRIANDDDASADDASADGSTPSVIAGRSNNTGLSDTGVADNADSPGSAGGDLTVALASAGQRCVSLGPFLNLRDATEATARLNAQGLEPSQRLSESQVWFGHWVHLPPAASRAEAIAVVELLRSKGVTDIYIEPSGPMRHSISLGVFSDAAHAETRAGQIRRLSVGVSPQIRDRYRDSSVYWVDFDMPAGQVVDPAGFKSSSSQQLTLEGRECNKAADT